MTIADQNRRDLETAVELLESPSFVAKLSDLIGEPIEKVVSGLPVKASKRVEDVVHSALVSLMNLAGRTLGDDRPKPASTITHKLAATVSGAIGGAFGLAALSVELPITTSIILRSIADIAAQRRREPRLHPSPNGLYRGIRSWRQRRVRRCL